MKKFTVRGKMHYAPDKEVEVTFHYTDKRKEDGYLTGDETVIMSAVTTARAYSGKSIEIVPTFNLVSDNHEKNPFSMSRILTDETFLEGTVKWEGEFPEAELPPGVIS